MEVANNDNSSSSSASSSSSSSSYSNPPAQTTPPPARMIFDFGGDVRTVTTDLQGSSFSKVVASIRRIFDTIDDDTKKVPLVARWKSQKTDGYTTLTDDTMAMYLEEANSARDPSPLYIVVAGPDEEDDAVGFCDVSILKDMIFVTGGAANYVVGDDEIDALTDEHAPTGGSEGDAAGAVETTINMTAATEGPTQTYSATGGGDQRPVNRSTNAMRRATASSRHRVVGGLMSAASVAEPVMERSSCTNCGCACKGVGRQHHQYVRRGPIITRVPVVEDLRQINAQPRINLDGKGRARITREEADGSWFEPDGFGPLAAFLKAVADGYAMNSKMVGAMFAHFSPLLINHFEHVAQLVVDRHTSHGSAALRAVSAFDELVTFLERTSGYATPVNATTSPHLFSSAPVYRSAVGQSMTSTVGYTPYHGCRPVEAFVRRCIRVLRAYSQLPDNQRFLAAERIGAELTKESSKAAISGLLAGSTFGSTLHGGFEEFRAIGIRCDKCGVSPLPDFRFKCRQCVDYDLCSTCYLTNPHDISHKFLCLIKPGFKTMDITSVGQWWWNLQRTMFQDGMTVSRVLTPTIYTPPIQLCQESVYYHRPTYHHVETVCQICNPGNVVGDVTYCVKPLAHVRSSNAHLRPMTIPMGGSGLLTSSSLGGGGGAGRMFCSETVTRSGVNPISAI